ncbi:MAG: Gfo/Idh/MocA family oxidoreductase [Rhodospirillales bacterium]|nr:Gfo/Idh/MocA family oxidoreductase [Rhodospirillales bacterium]
MTYRFGIIGAGIISEFHAKAIAAMENAELVAVYGRRIEQAETVAQAHKCAAYADYDAFLAHEGLDIVTICTPSGAHLEPVERAARAGKHIICEKPLEVTTERVDQMIAACAANKVMLAGIFPRRFNRATGLLKQAIDDGRFGKINMADAYVKWWRTQDYYDSGAWRGTWDLDGGGALMNQSIHTIDLLLHVMGDVKSVRAETRLVAHRGIEVEDTAVAMLEFKSGALGVIQGSTACWSAAGHPAEVHITGSKGSVFMTDDKFRVWEFQDARPEDADIRRDYGLGQATAGAGAADPAAIDFRWHQKNFEDAVQALAEGRAAAIDGHEGRRSIALLNAIYRSAAEGGERQQVE